MQDLIYVGPCADGVIVPVPGGQDVVAPPGQPVAFPADLAARLLEQPANWRPATREAPAQEPPARKSR